MPAASTTALSTSDRVAPHIGAVLDAVSSLVCLLDCDGRVLHVNGPLLSLAGTRADEVTDRFLWECPWWHDDPAWQLALEKGIRDVATGTTLSYDAALKTRHDGHRPLALTLAPLHNPAGEVAQIVVSAADMSGLRAGEAALDRSEVRFRHVFEGAQDGMVMIDQQGRMNLVNRALEQLFGYARGELLGQPIEMLIPARYLPQHRTQREAYMATPEARPMAQRRELYARRKDGSEFAAEIGLNPLPLPEGMFVLATVVDVSQRRADEQAIQRALVEKTALLNEVHHRVKNNLQIISSLLSLQSRQAPPEARPYLDDSRERVKAMALIHQLLYERHDYANVNIALYLQRLGRLLHASLGNQRGRIAIETRNEESEVWIDLQQAVPCGLIVNELVTNAIKHAFPDGRSGQILILLRRDADGRCEIAVADNGIGLPADVTLGTSHSLGFQLLPVLIEQLGGELAIERDGGTRFVLRFAPITGEQS